MLTAMAEARLNNNPEKAVQLINHQFGKIPANRLIQYVMANVNIAAGNNDVAIRVLSQTVGVPSSVKIPFMDFMMGRCKLAKGDDDADIYFKNFIIYNKGNHFIKEAHQKLAWYALLKGDEAGYDLNMQQVLIKGSSTTEQDEQA